MTLCRYLLIGVALIALAQAGCSGGGPANRRPTRPVTVTVTYKGAPVEGATVTFQCQEGEPIAAYGMTDAQGKAKLKTYVEGDGAVVGPHKVAIEKSQTVGGQQADQDSPEYNPNAPPPSVKYLIPQKYALPGTSGLTAQVTQSGPNEFTFDLKD